MRPMILLVDVASADRTNWKTFLENQNFEVHTAGDGNEAVWQCLALQPDLVLLRDTLPDIDGLALCRRFKESPLNELIPVVLIGESAGTAEIARGRGAGAAEVWGACTSLEEGLSRMQMLLRLNSYIDEQVKAVVFSLAQGIEARDAQRAGHSERILELAVQLGEAVGLRDEELRELQAGCLLHDIGKVAVPDSILLKPGPLNAAEVAVIRQHPIVGEKICAPLKSLRSILPLIRHHHERMDGSGYPDGLCGEQIPLKARILQVADIYDALVNDRPYRKALPAEAALKILDSEAERGWLDAWLVREFSGIREASEQRASGRSMLASYYGFGQARTNWAFS